MTIPIARQYPPASGGTEFDGLRLVDGTLERFFSDGMDRADRLGAGYAGLWRALRSAARGGKRVRPALVLAAYTGLGGPDPAPAAPVAAAFELLHTALVLHDDVIDRDFKRRGVPNLAGVYRARAAGQGMSLEEAAHRGQSAAIIAGDLALTGAYRLIAGAELAADLRLTLLDELDSAVFASAGGELLDVEFSGTPEQPSLQEVLRMSRLKTAVYSFEAPLRAGALMAGASADALRTVGTAGRCIGTAYQLVDDLLGMFGDEAETGKSTTGDLAEGKCTPLIAYARLCPEWEQLAELLGGTPTRQDAARARRLLEQCGAREYVEDLAECYASRARAALAESALPEALVADLESVLERAVQRRR
ncbi:polyprenyl synthetase family protein [Arthrobacter mangrovi]|uniref:Geranylgeranyl pyrophosphate synthase n=1 Tax=Arthrobacter mangrovi TaxID=2966350 RepID=A0ABQ5MUN3_9MICC|nr:polyprenyl synthetase family protein [Arthrobacter mangrovi]GLB67691.1 geranylgeranyl pyrophosphate synthase [Arthrobacter mangrovi]